ncbi:hypothetical protein ACSSS7_005192 [Eimeria intestinalis]
MPRINPVSPPPSEIASPRSNSYAAAAAAGGDKGTREADLSAGRHQHAAPTHQQPIYLFYTIHVDKPGVLAAILSLLSTEQINVANCHLGRRSREETPTAAAAAGAAATRQGRGDEGSPREVLGMCIFHTDSAVTAAAAAAAATGAATAPAAAAAAGAVVLLLLLLWGQDRNTEDAHTVDSSNRWDAVVAASPAKQQQQQQQHQHQLQQR